ncbi:DUF4003 family protein [Bacillus sp. AGMB 02131]|uniref:DUF4003 family protein n=1 Tax=Peribacillus faecalis TaxID=2772559 RepID=A0A927HAP8_9BACI|nr:DUF4003 family protein [Peribacillus faecalis]
MKKNAALQLAIKNQRVNLTEIKDMVDYMKKSTSAFSYFRHSLFPIAALLTTYNDSRQLFDQTVHYYDRLKEHFRRSSYLPYVALFLAAESKPEKADHTIETAAHFYKLMKERHFWLTSDDDYMFAVLLANNNLEPTHAVDEMTECYRYLNERGIRKGNALQAMSHILVLSDEPVYKKCDRLLEYEQLLKAEKIKLDMYSRSLLAVLTIVEQNVHATVSKIVETDSTLASQKGFGNWSFGRSARNMFSIAVTVSEDLQNTQAETIQATIQNNIQSLLLAQQAAMTAGVAAAASSSNSSSNS